MATSERNELSDGSCSEHSVDDGCDQASETSPLFPCPVDSDVFRRGASPNLEASVEHKVKDFQLIRVPKNDKVHKPPLISLRKLWAFTGPGFLMSIAYLDPGNIEGDLQAGAVAQYKLLWVLLSSTIAGLLMQLLAVRLGVASGKHLAEVCKDEYSLVPRLLLWIAMELAIIGSDIQEVIGSAIAINILSQNTIPLWEGCLITGIDTFTFLFLESYGLRYLEAFFGVLITLMCIMFGWMYASAAPSQVDVLRGLVIPACHDCKNHHVEKALGLVGAIIMPHNIYLHSGLVLSRAVSRRDQVEVREAIKYNTIESTIALTVSFVINLFVICVFGARVYNYEYDTPTLSKACSSDGINLLSADQCLYHAFGRKEWIIYIWALGLLASGQSSTMTGTYAGQFVMEGFLGLKWAKWKRVLLTRSLAMVPCVILAVLATRQLDVLDDLINVEQSMLLPFSVLPILFATSTRRIMGPNRNNIVMTVVVWLIAIAVMGVNCYFIIDKVAVKGPWYQHVFVSLGLLTYVGIVIFFVVFPIIQEVRYWKLEKHKANATKHSINNS